MSSSLSCSSLSIHIIFCFSPPVPTIHYLLRRSSVAPPGHFHPSCSVAPPWSLPPLLFSPLDRHATPSSSPPPSMSPSPHYGLTSIPHRSHLHPLSIPPPSPFDPTSIFHSIPLVSPIIRLPSHFHPPLIPACAGAEADGSRAMKQVLELQDRISMRRPSGDRGQLLFDRVLVDAPCSGLGVLGKRGDLR